MPPVWIAHHHVSGYLRTEQYCVVCFGNGSEDGRDGLHIINSAEACMVGSVGTHEQ
jgi:hypothetical protein